MTDGTIRFPGLGIILRGLKETFTVFGFPIAFYGVLLTSGIILGYFIADANARRLGQGKDRFLDFAILAVIVSVIGARIYFVIFSWDHFKDNPLSIFNLRTGGLAIYGAIIAAVTALWFYCKKQKWSFPDTADTLVVGLVLGQVPGRWGNFLNREAFGEYTSSFLRMLIPKADVNPEYITTKMAEHLVNIDGIEFISVHPTFLYEQLWNIGLFLFLWFYTKHKKFSGEIFLLYLAGYGLGRTWIEGLRSDQLLLWKTNIPVSQLLSAVLFFVCMGIWVWQRRKKKNQEPFPKKREG